MSLRSFDVARLHLHKHNIKSKDKAASMHAKRVIAFVHFCERTHTHVHGIPYGNKITNNLIDVLKSLNERAIAQNLTNEMFISTISTII